MLATPAASPAVHSGGKTAQPIDHRCPLVDGHGRSPRRNAVRAKLLVVDIHPQWTSTSSHPPFSATVKALSRHLLIRPFT